MVKGITFFYKHGEGLKQSPLFIGETPTQSRALFNRWYRRLYKSASDKMIVRSKRLEVYDRDSL